MAHAAINLNFELEEGFTLHGRQKARMRPVEHAVQGNLKEVVASAWTTFTWQSSKEGERLPVEAGAFKDWLSSRPLALRPIYWEISSDAYTHRCFKMGYEADLRKELFGVRRYVEQVQD